MFSLYGLTIFLIEDTTSLFVAVLRLSMIPSEPLSMKSFLSSLNYSTLPNLFLPASLKVRPSFSDAVGNLLIEN